MSKQQYEAEFAAIQLRMERRQAELERIRAEAQQRLDALAAEQQQDAQRRERVIGALEALA